MKIELAKTTTRIESIPGAYIVKSTKKQKDKPSEMDLPYRKTISYHFYGLDILRKEQVDMGNFHALKILL